MPDFSGPIVQPEIKGFEGRNDNKIQQTLSDSMYASLGAQEISWGGIGGLSEGVNDTSVVYIYMSIDLQLCNWFEGEVNRFP